MPQEKSVREIWFRSMGGRTVSLQSVALANWQAHSTGTEPMILATRAYLRYGTAIIDGRFM